MFSLRSGTIDVVMLPMGSRYIPPIPERFECVEALGIGAGIYIFNPEKISAKEIEAASFLGDHGKLLGHIYTKAEIAKNPAVVVCAVSRDGTPIQESAVLACNPEAIEKQKAILSLRHPHSTISTLLTPTSIYRERVKSRK